MNSKPRANLNFDTGIGADDSAADPRLSAALGAMQAGKLAEDKKALAPAPAPVPAPPQPVLAAHAAPPDEYRTANPSLPLIPFSEVKHLPSMGKSYPAGATVRFRPYTFGEAIFAEQSNLTMRQTYDMILKGLDCSFDPMQLTLPDVLFLGLIRKMASLPGNPNVTVTTSCPHCHGLNRTPIAADTLEFADLQVPALPIKVKLSIGEHTFSPLTLSAYLNLLDRGLEDDFPALMAAQCTSMSDLDVAIETIRNLTNGRDIALVKKVDELLHHELKPVTVTCPQEVGPAPQEGDEAAPTCGKAYPVSLDDVSATFVLPFRWRNDDSLLDQISFGS